MESSLVSALVASVALLSMMWVLKRSTEHPPEHALDLRRTLSCSQVVQSLVAFEACALDPGVS